MAPKKTSGDGSDAAAAPATASGILAGFLDKETKWLAAGMLAQTAPGVMDYAILAEVTGSTKEYARVSWGKVKRKAAESYPQFSGVWVGSGDGAPKTPKKNAAGRKRKVEAEADGDAGDTNDDEQAEKKTAKKGRGRPKKKAKIEEQTTEDAQEAEDSTEAKVKDEDIEI